MGKAFLFLSVGALVCTGMTALRYRYRSIIAIACIFNVIYYKIICTILVFLVLFIFFIKWTMTGIIVSYKIFNCLSHGDVI